MQNPISLPLCLPMGNRKVGRALTFSLPALLTCPGYSKLCARICYAMRFERLRPNCRRAYSNNLVLSWNTDTFVKTMLENLSQYTALVRLHVSGDFYAPSYVKAWTQICKSRPKTLFWGYSRSWTVPKMARELRRLRNLPNVQLFASVDSTMKLPPRGWRRAFLSDDHRASGTQCRHQQGQCDSCEFCGYCLEPGGNVVFKIH